MSGDDPSQAAGACDGCLRRPWLLERLAAHLERVRQRIGDALALSDDELIPAVAGADADAVRRELAAFDPDRARERAAGAGLELICRCSGDYPARLRELHNPATVLHVAGGLERVRSASREHPVALVGSRRASGYGLDVARSLGRQLVAAGLPVVSGMALGVDAAAHAGALAAAADGQLTTVAVMPGGADRAYPSSKRALHEQIVRHGVAVSELPPGAAVWRWTFPARNRIIAALAVSTVVVEAGERSGALLTARVAAALGRPIGAVPGRVTSPHAAGPNGLLAGGAYVVRDAQDVLDRCFGASARQLELPVRAPPPPELGSLLEAIAAGRDTPAALISAGYGRAEGLAGLAALELGGWVQRGAGGRYSVVP